MKPTALQQLIGNIFSNAETRAKFLENPEATIREYDLTERERRAILATQSRLGLVTVGGVQFDEAIDPNIIWSSPVP